MRASTSLSKEPNLAHFGVTHERETDLAHYADRRLPKVNEKTLEQKFQNHR